MSFLKIYSGEIYRDYQLSGNYDDYINGLTKAPQDNLLSYYFQIATGDSVTNIEAYKILFVKGTLTNVEIIDLTSDITLQSNVNFRYYNAGSGLTSNLDSGIYYLKFTTNLGYIFESELFCVVDGLYSFGKIIDFYKRAIIDINGDAYIANS
jgi:hypothetical protein